VSAAPVARRAGTLGTTLALCIMAAGCAGVAVENRFGIAVKCWDGSPAVVDSALVATLTALEALPGHVIDDLAPYARPVVLGGETPVGELETLLELEWS